MHQIQQDNEDARDEINKFAAIIWNEEETYFEQVFYILVFDAVFINNKLYFSLYFDQILD